MADSLPVQNITMGAGRIGQECPFGVDEIGQNSFGSARGFKRQSVTQHWEEMCIQLSQHYV